MAKAKNSHPASYSSLSDQEISVVNKVYAYTEEYFKNPRFDASHDFNHVKRVVANALTILEKEEELRNHKLLPALNPLNVILGALLHDVEDKKYLTGDEISSPTKRAVIEAGLSEDYAAHMQQLVEGVSYSSEVKDPRRVIDLIEAIPELAIVQDADRLDAIGAIGIGRCFTFTGAMGFKSLQDAIDHFEDKLLKLEAMMKTESGMAMAEERSARIREFMSWWREEVDVVNQ